MALFRRGQDVTERERQRRRLTTVALVVFAVVDMVLVVIAYQQSRPEMNDAVAESSSSQPDAAPPSATASGSSGSSSAAGRTVTVTSEQLPAMAVAAGPQGLVVRSTAGNCVTGIAPIIEVSNDSGASFDPTQVANLRQVYRVVASGSQISIVGLDGGCAPTGFTSTDGGQTWTTAKQLGSWYVPPGQVEQSVPSPRGPRSTPCTPLDVATVGASQVRVLCDNGRVISSDDAGASWTPRGRVPQASAISFSTADRGVALAKRAGCATVFTTSDDGRTWDSLTCLGKGTPMAVAASGSTIVAQVGDALRVSIDSGSTFDHQG